MDHFIAATIINALTDSDTPAVREAGSEIISTLLRENRLVRAGWDYGESVVFGARKEYGGRDRYDWASPDLEGDTDA